MDQVIKAAFFVVMLGGLIIIHEAGHFLAARLAGVRVREFGLGLPPRALRLGEWRGTVFSLNWVPLGGFVRPEGEFDPQVPGGLAASAPWKRLLVFAAGPLANLLAGFMALALAFHAGWPDRLVVEAVLPGSPAAEAGLWAGDVLARAGGRALHEPQDWLNLMDARRGLPVALDVRRGGQAIQLTIVPGVPELPDGRLTGVTLKRELVRYGWAGAARRALERVGLQVRETVRLPLRAALGQARPGEFRLAGLVGLKQVSDMIVDRASEAGQLHPLLNLTAVVSIGLGLTNLLPLAALDGGRIAFTLLEIARRRPVAARKEKWVHMAGLAALLGLMVALVVQDLQRPLF